MRQRHVLISGAGIAGPALAYWLERHGIASTIVERSTGLREGGQAVDFRGPVHRSVLGRMNIWDAIHYRRTRPGDLVLLDAGGAPWATLPAVMTGGDVEILRGDLCHLLHQRTVDTTDYRFGDRIVVLEDRGDCVAVEFEHAPAQAFDLVVGADGLHSTVRSLVFGEESSFLRHHGYRIATFSLPNLLGIPRGGALYSEPGRGAYLAAAGEEARALLVFRGGPLGAERRDVELQKREIEKEFRHFPWEAPRLLAALDGAQDLYVDAIASVLLDHYARGRVALVGDAAYGGTLGGQGSALAIIGAYVLAGELAAESDPTIAFARYEARLRPYATRCQRGAARAGPFFAPRTRAGLLARNVFYRALTSRWFVRSFERMTKSAATDFALPDYAA